MINDNKKRHIVICGKKGGGIAQVQSDWTQQDNTQPDYIKNKPNVDNMWFGTKAEYDLIDPKDPNTVYYIEGNYELENLNATANGTYQSSTKYGYDEVTVNVQPNLTTLNATANGTYTPTSPVQGYNSVTVNVQESAPQYLTATYLATAPSNSYLIVYETSNVNGWRFKGDLNWETAASTITVNSASSFEIEFDLIDDTKIGGAMFQNTNLIDVKLPSTITTIEYSAFYNSNISKVPNLTNVTELQNDVFTYTIMRSGNVVIDDNVTRNYNLFAFYNNQNWDINNGYVYVNGSLLYFPLEKYAATNNIDLSNGIDGLSVTKFYSSYQYKTINTVKLPSTLTDIGDAIFYYSTIDSVYFYGTTPPTFSSRGYNDLFYGSNISHIYVPQGSLSAYQNAYYLSNYTSIISEIF